MRDFRLPSPLLAVTDRHGHSRPLVETVRAVLAGGCRWVWFRDRDMPQDERRDLGQGVLAAVREAGGRLSIGGDAGLAATLGADGVQLGGGTDPAAITRARRLLGPGALIGVSAHSLPEIAAAAAACADYVTISPIFETQSKPGYGPALGLVGLAAAARLGIPAVALGGITPETVPACRRAGAAGIAVLGGVMRADDPAAEARRYRAAWDEAYFGAAGP